ncbi:MAG: hypothetical protein ACQESE_02460 [Nanobdellota archaeon]
MNKDILGFKTERGSIYTVEADGRIQRTKVATGEVDPSSDFAVYIPSFEKIDQDYSSKYPEIMKYMNKYIANSDIGLEQFILDFIYHHKEGEHFHVTNYNMKRIVNKKEFDNYKNKPIFMRFQRVGNNNLYLPVSPEIRLDYRPFENTYYFDNKGKVEKKNIHIGHKIIDISRK